MKTLLERFNQKWELDSETGCWVWTASCFYTGYGQIRVDADHMDYAHRVSYRLFKGPIPDRIEVKHTCDNTMCVNHEHLVLDTHEGNMRDMVVKGRSASGSKHHAAKLTDEVVVQARKEYAAGTSYRKLADCYGVTIKAMYDAVTGKTWKHIP